MSDRRFSKNFLGSYALAALLLLAGCAAKQRVTLDCLPEHVAIFVDGKQLESDQSAVELDSDRPHIVMFRAPGYRPRMVVINTDPSSEGSPRLHPTHVCADLLARQPHMERHLDLKVDRQPPANPGLNP